MRIDSDLPCIILAEVIAYFYEHPLVYWLLASVYLLWTMRSCLRDFRNSDWIAIKAWLDKKRINVKQQ